MSAGGSRVWGQAAWSHATVGGVTNVVALVTTRETLHNFTRNFDLETQGRRDSTNSNVVIDCVGASLLPGMILERKVHATID